MAVELFVEVALIVIFASAFAILSRYLNLPAIIGYILAGIFLSPLALNIVQSSENLEFMARIGVAFLLFMVGLHLNPGKLKNIAKSSIYLSIFLILITLIFVFSLLFLQNFTLPEIIILSLALSFNSTIIIMKIFSDKRELETLHGKMGSGLLIAQDIMAILILIALPLLNQPGLIILEFGKVIFYGTVLTVALFLLSWKVLPRFESFIAKSTEVLFMFSIGWLFLAVLMYINMGMSIETGALLAGVALSISPYSQDISSRVKPLRDFFLMLFFIFLGAQLNFNAVQKYVHLAIALSLFILILRPLFLFLALRGIGYTKKTSFILSSSFSQISEFSIIIVLLATSLNYVPRDFLSLATVLGIMTILPSSYMIANSTRLYSIGSRYLDFLGKETGKEEMLKTQEYDVIVFGLDRIGHDILQAVRELNVRYLIVDYNPDIVKKLKGAGHECIYGDASNAEFLDNLNFEKCRMVISTISDFDTNSFITEKVRKVNKGCIVIAVSHNVDEALDLYSKGASYVLLPHFVGGYHTSILISEYKFSYERFLREKIKHLDYLDTRKKLGHKHPKHLK